MGKYDYYNLTYPVNYNNKGYKPNNISFGQNPVKQQNDSDSFTKTSENKFDYSVDDGKISFWDKVKSFGKGIISPITNMLKSPKDFLIGAGMILAGAGLLVATGGAAAPILVAAGVTMGGIQLGTSAIRAANAQTDEEARIAWEGIGGGTSAIVLSVAGAKSSLKAAGFADDAANMNVLQATGKCFKIVPSQTLKSGKMFVNGEALTNVKNIFETKPNNTETSNTKKTSNNEQKPVEENKVDNKNSKTEQKPVEEKKIDDKNSKTEQKPVEEKKIDDKNSKTEQKPVEEKKIDDKNSNNEQKPVEENKVDNKNSNNEQKPVEENKVDNKNSNNEQKPVEENKVDNKNSNNEQKPVEENKADNKNSKTKEKPVDENKVDNKNSNTEQKPVDTKQAEYDAEMNEAREFIAKYGDELYKKVYGDEIWTIDPADLKVKQIKKSELIKPYKEELGEIYHGTSESSYNSIMENGFDISRRPVHGYQNSGEGVYFGLQEGNAYGNYSIKAKFNGKVAEVNSGMINGIKTNYKNKFSVQRILKANGVPDEIAMDRSEQILGMMTNEMIKNEGYAGIITNDYSYAASGQYFQALDPKYIEIIK